MKVQCFLVLVLCYVFLFSPGYASQASLEKDQARSEWILGFHKLQEAEYSEEFGNYEKALDLLNEAKRIFKRVQKAYATWNRSLLSYRIKYCEHKITKIEKRNDLSTIDLESIKTKAEDNQNLIRRNESLVKDNRNLEKSNLELKNQIKKLRNEFEHVKNRPQDTAKITVFEKELERVKRKKVEIETVNSNLEAQVYSLNEEVNRLRSEQGKSIMKVAERDRDNKLLLAKLSDQDRKMGHFDQLFELKQDRIRELDQKASKVANLQKKIDEISTELKQGKESNIFLNRQNEKFQEELKNSLAEMEIYKSDLLYYKGEIAAQSAALEEEKLKATQSRNQILELKAELVRVRDVNVKLEEDLQEAVKKLSFGSDSLSILEQKLAKKNIELVELQEARKVNLLEFEEQKAHLGSLKKELDSQKNSNKLFQETIHNLKEEITLKINLENKLKTERLEYKAKYLAMENSCLSEKDRYNALLDLNKKLKSKIEELYTQLVISDEIQANLANLNNQLGQARKLGDEFHAIFRKVDSPSQAFTKEKTETDKERNKPKDLDTPVQLNDHKKYSESPNPLQQKKDLPKKTRITEDLSQTKRATPKMSKEPKSDVSPQSFNKREESLNVDETIEILLAEGIKAIQMKQQQKAQLKFNQILDLNRNHKASLLELSKIFIEAKDYENAEKKLKRAFHNDSEDPEILTQLGYVLIQLEKDSLAIWTLNKAVALHPNNPVLFQLLGTAYSKVGRLDIAEIQLKKAFELDKSNALTAYNLAILYAAMEPPRVESLKEWYELAKSLGAKNEPNLDDLLKEYTAIDILSK